MTFADRAALEHEIASNLRHGRVFVRGARGIEVLDDCSLVLVHPDGGAELGLAGQAVLVSDSAALCGIGVQLRPFDPQIVAKLEAFARGELVASDAQPAADGPAQAAPPAASGVAPAEAEPGAQPQEESAAAASAESETREELEPDGGDERASDLQQQPARHERLRKLSVTEQHKIARAGELNDRVVLERIYGKGVWESLLHNPKLTLPEVARIARKGTIPRPLLDLIVDNNGWIQAPVVRRALLGNPRLSSEGIMKLLRITPKHELKSIYKTTTYSSQVREAARKVLEL